MTQLKGQGQSDVTYLKQQDYQEFLRGLWFKWVIGAIQKPYFQKTIIYIDTNAGSGYNEEVGCNGSPLIFLSEAERLGLKYRAYLIEKDPALLARLSRRVFGYNAETICGNNGDIVPKILERIPPKSLGLMYVDPNGIPDWDMISSASQNETMKKIDILIRFNSVALIRNHHNGYLPLPSYLEQIKNKPNWYGKDYYHSDEWHWTFLLGMDYRFGDWKAKGWRSFDNPDGQDLKDKLTYKKDDYQKKRQPPLTGLMQSTSDIPDLELSERKRFGGLRESVKDAIKGQLRKFIT